MIDLSGMNTFKVAAHAKAIIKLDRHEQIGELVDLRGKFERTLILGLGANILLTKDFDGLVIKNSLLGTKILYEDKTNINIEMFSGENWHEFVLFCVKNGWQGVENLAYIPSTIGAAVSQNIAAYGQNVEDVVKLVRGINLKNGEKFEFTKQQCEFGYRDSFFKKTENQNYFVTSVVFQLSKMMIFNTSYHERYESLANELLPKLPPYTLFDIYSATISLRKRKLPDWEKIGTAGSFFKNPVVSKEKYLSLSSEIKELQWYPAEKLSYSEEGVPEDEYVKIPAARLLDELGWRGKRIGNVGTFEKQALAIVNHGKATGEEILHFSKSMQESIKKNYDIELVPEVKIF